MCTLLREEVRLSLGRSNYRVQDSQRPGLQFDDRAKLHLRKRIRNSGETRTPDPRLYEHGDSRAAGQGRPG